MLRTALFILAAAFSTGASAQQSADGNWFCGSGGDDLGALVVDGARYRVTNAADIEDTGTFVLSPDRTHYEVASGALRDTYNVFSMFLDRSADRLLLVFIYENGIVATGDCRRT